MFLSLRAEPEQYLFLDAAQLVKHYLGLNHTYPLKRRVLVYLYWEAANAEVIRVPAHTRKWFCSEGVWVPDPVSWDHISGALVRVAGTFRLDGDGGAYRTTSRSIRLCDLSNTTTD